MSLLLLLTLPTLASAQSQFCVEFCNGGPCQCFEPLATCARDQGVCDSSGRCTGVCTVSGLSIGLIVVLVILLVAGVLGCVYCCCIRNRAATKSY